VVISTNVLMVALKFIITLITSPEPDLISSEDKYEARPMYV